MHGTWQEWIWLILFLFSEPIAYLFIGVLCVGPMLYLLRQDSKAKKKHDSIYK